jgi:NAD(P)-dependent dehydrogenase (short-subunit alcohol dehydrogenase family)
MAPATPSFLGLEDLHVFITGAAGGIGGAAVKEFLSHGARVTGLDRNSISSDFFLDTDEDVLDRFHFVKADLTDEKSVAEAFQSGWEQFGTPNILVANAGITNEQAHPPIWEISADLWDSVNAINVRGTFLTIKHFLLTAKQEQDASQKELENLAIVLTGSETGKFGQEGHAEYASGKAGLQYGLVKTVKNEIVRLNSKARINAVAPGWVNTRLIGNRLDDPKEMWSECQSTVALKKIAQPEDVARTMAFLASHRAAGHISGECISVDGGQEGRLLWKEDQILGNLPTSNTATARRSTSIPASLAPPKRARRIRVCLSIDFDAISGYLGTGHDEHNTLSDYSAGIFSAKVGVGRLLRLFKKHDISDKVTWFIPGRKDPSPFETPGSFLFSSPVMNHPTDPPRLDGDLPHRHLRDRFLRRRNRPPRLLPRRRLRNDPRARTRRADEMHRSLHEAEEASSWVSCPAIS